MSTHNYWWVLYRRHLVQLPTSNRSSIPSSSNCKCSQRYSGQLPTVNMQSSIPTYHYIPYYPVQYKLSLQQQKPISSFKPTVRTTPIGHDQSSGRRNAWESEHAAQWRPCRGACHRHSEPVGHHPVPGWIRRPVLPHSQERSAYWPQGKAKKNM